MRLSYLVGGVDADAVTGCQLPGDGRTRRHDERAVGDVCSDTVEGVCVENSPYVGAAVCSTDADNLEQREGCTRSRETRCDTCRWLIKVGQLWGEQRCFEVYAEPRPYRGTTATLLSTQYSHNSTRDSYLNRETAVSRSNSHTEPPMLRRRFISPGAAPRFQRRCLHRPRP